MKKFLSLLLAVLMLLSFAACSGSDNDSDIESEETEESNASEKSESSEESEESESDVRSPIINGNKLSDYKIIYQELNIMDREACRYKDLALEIQDYFKKTYSQTVQIADQNSKETKKEIILGFIRNRNISANYTTEYGYDKYKVVIKGDKIWICGNYASGIYQGFEALVEKFNSSEDGIFGDTEFSGQGKVIKVSAVGDSITQGINSYNYTQVYPYYLQKMLGFDYYVLNSGRTSTSICTIDGEFCYSRTDEYRVAIDFKPDVVLFGLGTNDANPHPDYPNKNWENPANNRIEVFKRDTKALWDSFYKANPDVQIFVILPPSLIDKPQGAFWRPVEWTANIKKYSHPLLVELAEEYELPTVDMFPWSQKNPDIFTDGLHPIGESYHAYASYIYDGISELIKKPE